jgi:hypothetical protein
VAGWLYDIYFVQLHLSWAVKSACRLYSEHFAPYDMFGCSVHSVVQRWCCFLDKVLFADLVWRVEQSVAVMGAAGH